MEKEQQNAAEKISEPLQIYLNEIGQIPLLSEEEERSLGGKELPGRRRGTEKAFGGKSASGRISGKTLYREEESRLWI